MHVAFMLPLLMLKKVLPPTFCADIDMVRKRRTEIPSSGGESSESQESGGGSGRGTQRPSDRGAPPQQGAGGGYQGGRGWGPQSQQGGRGGGYGGGRGRGGMSQQQQQQQQYYGGIPEYQGRGRGGPPQQVGRGGYGGGRSGTGRGGPSSGPSRSQDSDLHQATPLQCPAGVTSQSPLSEASSSSRPPEPSVGDVSQQMRHLGIKQEGSSSQALQTLAPTSSKSMRFPLRPGKGSTGIRCIVKANHFFAELPDKDLHQYDVSSLIFYAIYLVIFLIFFFNYENGCV